MTSFEPFADDSRVLKIGDLSLENGTDAITIQGDIDIRRDKAGLASAISLRDALDAVIKTLQTQDLPDHIAAPERSTKTFDSPFGGNQ